MTIFSVNIMWAIVLFGILLWTTASMVLNAALRLGMGRMGLVLSYAVLVWMFIDLPWREVAATWGLFAALGGALSVPYELWARRRYADTGRAPRTLIRVEGVLLWPTMIPDAIGLMLNSAGILPADDRNETHAEDRQMVRARTTSEHAIPDIPSGGDMAGPVSWVLETPVHPERSDELRALIEEMVANTHTHELGAQNYEWFMSADGRVCHLYERYVDSAAALVHCQTFGTRFAGRFMSLLTPTRCTVYGSPDAAVQAALSVLNPTYMGQAAGFYR